MPGPALPCKFCEQFLRAQHGAGQGIADPDGQRRNIRLAFLHHVEMRVEGRGLEHFRKGKLHLVGECGEVGGGDLVIFVLDEMQVLDQEIAPPRPVAEQHLDFMGGLRIDLAPLRGRLGPPASLARMLEGTDLVARHTHRNINPVFPNLL